MLNLCTNICVKSKKLPFNTCDGDDDDEFIQLYIFTYFYSFFDKYKCAWVLLELFSSCNGSRE